MKLIFLSHPVTVGTGDTVPSSEGGKYSTNHFKEITLKNNEKCQVFCGETFAAGRGKASSFPFVFALQLTYSPVASAGLQRKRGGSGAPLAPRASKDTGSGSARKANFPERSCAAAFPRPPTPAPPRAAAPGGSPRSRSPPHLLNCVKAAPAAGTWRAASLLGSPSVPLRFRGDAYLHVSLVHSAPASSGFPRPPAGGEGGARPALGAPAAGLRRLRARELFPWRC